MSSGDRTRPGGSIGSPMVVAAAVFALLALGWAVRKSDVALLERLNQHIGMLRSSGSWNHLLDRYFTPDALALFVAARKP